MHMAVQLEVCQACTAVAASTAAALPRSWLGAATAGQQPNNLNNPTAASTAIFAVPEHNVYEHRWYVISYHCKFLHIQGLSCKSQTT